MSAPTVPAAWDTVRIRDMSGGWSPWERLSVAEGVERPLADGRYIPGAFVPRGRWRPVPGGLLAAVLEPKTTWDINRTIGIVRIPESSYRELARIGVARARNMESYLSGLAHVDFAAALEEAAMALAEHMVSADGLQVLGPLARLPGMRTVTPDAEGSPLVGLHLDAWDVLFPTGWVTNRICVNLGCGERAFLYVPFSTASFRPKEVRGSSDWVERFFEANPSCPVMRIRLAPGEAYIAPTENVLHDGATELSRTLDVTLTLRGQFGLRTSASTAA